HGLQLKMDHRFSSGLSLLGWYTFQKSIDDASGFAGFRTVGTIGLQDNHNLLAERGISTFDRTHNAVVAGLYELPFGAGKRFASRNKLASAVLGGWQINGILSLRSGVPLSMFTAQNLTGSLGGGSRPNRLRSGKLPESERSILRWFDEGAFAAPPQFQFGNTSRTEPDLRGPGLAQLDFSLFRNVRFGEKTTLQFRAEAFNALNRVNFSVPNTTIGSSAVGIITGAGDARTIQFGARLSF
ncbi:MAG: carboxypeptidase regulatory-like domain-containing protein, partial [Acidobacteria bacterium]|nr:carboxypeptidase regulatory-like domain-containing protein [Acidobacteriota bacterium]